MPGAEKPKEGLWLGAGKELTLGSSALGKHGLSNQGQGSRAKEHAGILLSRGQHIRGHIR